MRKCFFVTPIGDEFSAERKNSDTLLKHFIDPICKSLNFEVIRIDQLNSVDSIDRSIIEHLETDDLVIADLTGSNPNVFFEFGYRQALKLPLIPLIMVGEKIPFDVSTLRTIHYVTNDLDKVEEIKNKISQTINSFEFDSIPTKTDRDNSFDNIALLTIQDKLDEILSAIKQRNDNEIDRIADIVARNSHPQQTPETAMMSQLLPLILQKPELMDNLLKLGEKGNQINQ